MYNFRKRRTENTYEVYSERDGITVASGFDTEQEAFTAVKNLKQNTPLSEVTNSVTLDNAPEWKGDFLLNTTVEIVGTLDMFGGWQIRDKNKPIDRSFYALKSKAKRVAETYAREKGYI